MSILKDIGHITPRVDLVKVTVDGQVVGYYYMMEGESNSFFVNNKKVDGDIIGVDNDKLFVNYPIGGILDKKGLLIRVKENSRLISYTFVFFNKNSSIYFSSCTIRLRNFISSYPCMSSVNWLRRIRLQPSL